MVEDLKHLFFDCPFALVYWQKLGIVWDDTNDIHTLLQQGRRHFGMAYFIEIFIIAAWEIWNLRNAKIFEGQTVSFQLWNVKFKEQIVTFQKFTNQIHSLKKSFSKPIAKIYLLSSNSFAI